eukprot:COSAG05_NODE_2646_length_2806_cov_34.581455_1_plen_460_part_10
MDLLPDRRRRAPAGLLRHGAAARPEAEAVAAEAWIDESLDNDKRFEAVLANLQDLFIYCADGDLREALREALRTSGGIGALISQMGLITPQNIGADGQLVSYPLEIAGKKYFFGFKTRRAGVERLEKLEKEILEIKGQRRHEERLRAERESMGRRGRRRTAVVAAVVQPNHNQQLLQLLRAPLAGPPSSSGASSAASTASALHNSSLGSCSDAASSTESGSDGDDDKPATPARRARSPREVDTLTALHIAAANSPPSKGQFRTLHRLKIRSQVAPNSTPVGFLQAGTVVRLLEQVQHQKAQGHRTMSETGVMVEGSESGRITSGWIYTAVGFGGTHKSTVHGPLTKAEAVELKQALKRKEAAFAKEVAEKSREQTAQRLEHARRAKMSRCKGLAKRSGWLHLDEVTSKGCGSSKIEIRKFVRRWLESGEGKIGWFQELADSRHGDLVAELDISGATVSPC